MAVLCESYGGCASFFGVLGLDKLRVLWYARQTCIRIGHL